MLLVEDSPDDTELTVHALTNENNSMRLLHLKDGAEALNYLFKNKSDGNGNSISNLRLILLDLKLPKVDGLEVLRKIREEDSTRMLPVVILTSSGQKRDISEAYRLGVNSYVVKPVEFDNFIEKVGAIASYWGQINVKFEPAFIPYDQLEERNDSRQ